jgi:nucleotide-binding universal stress UspA family protein
VDESRRVIESRTDGSVLAESIDPDAGDVIVEKFDETMADRISAMSQIAGVECDFLASAGSPALALAQAAEESDAIMTVVRTRDATFRGTLREFFSGSVAVNLAHRQHRPVLVVRLSSVEALDVPTRQPLIYPLKPAPHSTPHGRR